MTEKAIAPERKSYKMSECTIDGCGRVARLRRGWCGLHYGRWEKKGSPHWKPKVERGEPLRWLLSHVDYEGDDCLIWPFGSKGGGYGVVAHNERAHRRMCIEAHGDPESDMEAAHSCGMGHKGCVNPRHLRWDTKTGNQRERLSHGTDNRGEKCGMAILKEDQVREIRALFKIESQVSLAKRFGVDRSTVRAIHSGRSWGWMT